MNYIEKTKEIGKRIKENRKEMGMTQYDLIEKLHIGRNTLSDIENGKKLPDAETLYSLCEIFNCEVGYILCDYVAKTGRDTDVMKELGISYKAIKNIKQYKNYHKVLFGMGRRNNLDSLLSNTNFIELLDKISKYKEYNEMNKTEEKEAMGFAIYRDFINIIDNL